jgi:uncharacterized BrkB/YihY/UPF0761 family membrane protein
MVLTLFAGLVGCFAVVSFFPFASLFKHSITAALSTGMGTLIDGLLFCHHHHHHRHHHRLSVVVLMAEFFVVGACVVVMVVPMAMTW